MKFLDNIAKKFTKTASATAKKEVRKTILDFIPGILTVGTMVAGILLFHETDGAEDAHSGPEVSPKVSTTRITTNNYFLGDVSEDLIKKILKEDD